MKCTDEQLENLAEFLDGTIGFDFYSILAECKNQNTANEKDMDEQDWDYLHELVQECIVCGHWTGVGNLQLSLVEDGEICWQCAENEGEDENTSG